MSTDTATGYQVLAAIFAMVTVSVGAYHSWRKTHPDWPPRGKWWLWIALDRIAFCALATLAITFLVRFVTPATPESAPATPQPKQSSPPIVPQDKPAPSPVKPVPAPIPPPVEHHPVTANATWAQRGFNASTKTELPIAVIAPDGKDPNHYLDNHVVGSISSLLSQDLNLVLPEDAALFVEITEARVDAGDTGQPCSNLYSMHNATARVTVKVEWLGQKPLPFPHEFSGSGKSCENDNSASDNAIDDAAAQVKDAILALANKQAGGTAN